MGHQFPLIPRNLTPRILEAHHVGGPGMRVVAALLGVPMETVYQWRRKRTGPSGFRVGRHLRYDPDALRRWIKPPVHRTK
ncbi:helix-turn-helix domain-containing protein [Streptomyces sp. NPDC019890]|uniref:helix-turn-helix domain-containing protein n=1 Tax=Streptomyces sp. NPDC019890 TaxID=3365064 RepID=UPI00384D9549